MNAINKSRTQLKVTDQSQAFNATSKLTVALFGGAAALIGLWAAACFVGALLSSGPLGLIKGYISAVTGL